eukprot:SAG25_NODE_2581_length_1516_cov_51.056966_1_plen_126_part_00
MGALLLSRAAVHEQTQDTCSRRGSLVQHGLVAGQNKRDGVGAYIERVRSSVVPKRDGADVGTVYVCACVPAWLVGREMGHTSRAGGFSPTVMQSTFGTTRATEVDSFGKQRYIDRTVARTRDSYG